MKKLVVLMAAMGLIGASYAGKPCKVQSMPSLVPANGHWIVGLTGLYLRPTVSSDELQYGTSSFRSTNSVGTNFYSLTNTRDLTIDPHYHGGFIFNLGYQLPCDCNDVMLSYLRLNSSDSEATNGYVNGNVFTGPGIGVVSSVPATFTGHSSINLDQVDLAFGHTTNLTQSIDVRLFAGLRYVNLDQTFNDTSHFTSTSGTPPFFASSSDSSSFEKTHNKFWGVGPLFGASGNYYLASCFGFTGQLDTAFAIGRPHHNFTSTDTSINTTTIFGVTTRSTNTSTFNSQTGTSYAVVPVMDGKLGAFYRMDVGCNTMLNIEGGYRAMHYFNIIHNHADLSYAGPYLGATIAI